MSLCRGGRLVRPWSRSDECRLRRSYVLFGKCPKSSHCAIARNPGRGVRGYMNQGFSRASISCFVRSRISWIFAILAAAVSSWFSEMIAGAEHDLVPCFHVES